MNSIHASPVYSRLPTKRYNPRVGNKKLKELSLRPYNGRLFVASSIEQYEAAHKKLFDVPDILDCSQVGRFTGGAGENGAWTYLVWGARTSTLAHEVAHCILHVFERCGIDPREGNGEPFCYMLSQLLTEATE